MTIQNCERADVNRTMQVGQTMIHPKHVMIAVVGKTPQIVTETLYGLMVPRGLPIEELYVITTHEGREALLGRPAQTYPVTLVEALTKLATHHQIIAPRFVPEHHILVAQEETTALHDIRSDTDNRLFPNLIAQFLRQKTEEPNTVLHCSIAGGRKTMSVAMASALSLFGRAEDKLYHVLAGERFEKSGKFFPENPDEDSEIVLSEVPYVRLRGLLEPEILSSQRSFMDMVQLAQEKLNRLIDGPFLKIDISNRSIWIGDTEIELQPQEFAVYIHYVVHETALPGGKGYGDSQALDLLRIYNKVAATEGHKTMAAKALKQWTTINKAISGVNRKLREALDADAEDFCIKQNKKYGANTYEIRLDRRRVIGLDELKRMF